MSCLFFENTNIGTTQMDNIRSKNPNDISGINVNQYDLKENVFVLNANEYTRKLNPVVDYVEQQAKFLSVMEEIPYEDARSFVAENIKPDGLFPIKNPKIHCVRKDENGDRYEDVDSTLLQYLKETFVSEDIMAATFTTFMPHKRKMSYISQYVEEAFPKRKALKKRQFQMKQMGNSVGEAFANNGQNNIKRSINSISGASSLPSTPIYCISMHPVLTSNCRMTSGYANANNEKLLGGNRHYHSADVTINNLVALTTNIDLEQVKAVVDQYNLYVPNSEELFEYILESTRNYWRWPEKEQIIREFITKCTREERACIAYIYDLHAMKRFNEEFMYSFIGKLSEKVDPIPGLDLEEAGRIFNSALDEIKIHAIQVHSDKVIGERESEYVKTDTVITMASQVINTYHVFQEYKDYIQTFLRSRHLPSSLAMLPAILRKVVLMSDTDSSIFTTEAWTKWYTNKSRGYKDKQLSTGVYSAMVMLSSLTLKHLLATMSANLGVPEKYIWGIAMKNEFNFVIFVNLNRTKHYIATIAIQEGNVYSELDIEKKGVHMRNSNSPQDIIKHAERIMEKLYNFHSDEKIKVLDVLKEVADAERKIIHSLEKGEPIYYRSTQIKEKESYKKEEDQSPFANYIFWNETFGKHYGMTDPPPYSSFNVKLDINNKTEMAQWLDSFENQELANDIRENLKKRNKDHLSTINVPYAVFTSQPIPKEIIPKVAKRDIVINLCAPYYIALEAVGFFFFDKFNSKLISDYY